MKRFNLRGDELPQFVVTTPFICKIDKRKNKFNRLFTITCCNFYKYLEILKKIMDKEKTNKTKKIEQKERKKKKDKK